MSVGGPASAADAATAAPEADFLKTPLGLPPGDAAGEAADVVDDEAVPKLWIADSRPSACQMEERRWYAPEKVAADGTDMTATEPAKPALLLLDLPAARALPTRAEVRVAEPSTSSRTSSIESHAASSAAKALRA